MKIAIKMFHVKHFDSYFSIYDLHILYIAAFLMRMTFRSVRVTGFSSPRYLLKPEGVFNWILLLISNCFYAIIQAKMSFTSIIRGGFQWTG